MYRKQALIAITSETDGKHTLHLYSLYATNTAPNPVARVPIHVSGDGSQLKLVELQEENTGEALEHTLSGIDTSRKEFAAVHSQLFSVQRQVSEVMNGTLQLRTEVQRGQQKMLSVLRRIAIQPIQRPTELQDETVRPRTVTLSKRPKDLYELWHEFKFGLNGAKASKLFTAAERGVNKFAYSRRKTFWDVVVYLVRAGFTSDVAIDKVYAAYGRQRSVTSILLHMRSDRRTGGHPELRE